MPPGLPASARWDYYCGWYHVHPRRRAGSIPNHPPCNLSIERSLFLRLGGFIEEQPIAYAHEELAWQAALRQAGLRILFEPRAVAYHWNRAGFGQLLRRNYRWAYCALESKVRWGSVRWPWLYRFPRLRLLLSPVLALAETGYIIAAWLRAGVLEPLVVFPVVFCARLAYAAGSIVGGWRWLSRQDASRAASMPRWT